MSDPQAYFLLGLDLARRFGDVPIDELTRSMVDLRERLASIHESLADVSFVQHGAARKQYDLEGRCIFMRATEEGNPGLPILTARWDFTSTDPQASIRVLIYYPGAVLSRWGFRWELPGGRSGRKHDFTHVQPIRELLVRSDKTTNPAVLSENVPTFMVSRKRDRPDLLLAHALLALYGEDPNLLALLRGLPNGDRVLQELG